MPTLVDELIAVIEKQHQALCAVHEWARFVDPQHSYRGTDLEALVLEALHQTVQGRPVSQRPLAPAPQAAGAVPDSQPSVSGS